VSDDEQRAKLLQRLAKLDQMIQEVDDSMVGVTLSASDLVYGIDKINHMKRSLSKVEVQLKQLRNQ
jgi:cyclopropane fatty-acyl-phospholipid synthase-like methyltransferase